MEAESGVERAMNNVSEFYGCRCLQFATTSWYAELHAARLLARS
jgi:hypothetical protein